jgi:hypothetical protein
MNVKLRQIGPCQPLHWQHGISGKNTPFAFSKQLRVWLLLQGSCYAVFEWKEMILSLTTPYGMLKNTTNNLARFS